jgi:hypothetical protein
MYTRDMNLAAFSSEKRKLIFQELLEGHSPPIGVFNEEIFKEGKDKGKPQMGATRYEAEAIVFEFIYPNPNGAPILLSVKLGTPERIVHMPVPEWVVESVWQGEVSGSYRFQSEAEEMLEAFRSSLASHPFEERTPIGRQ